MIVIIAIEGQNAIAKQEAVSWRMDHVANKSNEEEKR